jgi:hypothetical protein
VTRWIWVSMPHATFALRVTDGVVAEAPPVARWLVGKDERLAALALRHRGAVFRDLPQETP